MDHMERRTVRLGHVSCMVLDEADRMLDMGFREDIGTILQSVPEERQTVLFSATLSDEIKKIAAAHQNSPQQVCIQPEPIAVDKMKQFYAEIRGKTKTPALLRLLEEKKFALCLVFVSTKTMADSLAIDLSKAGHPANSIHGDLRQSQRNKVMKQYREGKIKILVATDVAARGIDVSGIDAVVNYDIPGDSDSYVHRIGRTGRANQDGEAYTFIYPKERAKLSKIMMDTKATILPVHLSPGAPSKQEPLVASERPAAKAKPYVKSSEKPSAKSYAKSSAKPYAKPYGKSYGKSAKSSEQGDGKKPWKKKRAYAPSVSA
jgi:ATP-dependent RNA helicase DeaD